MRFRLTRRRILALTLLFPIVAYVLAELTYTALAPVSAGTVGPNTFWVIEDKDSFRFDPILGYRTSQNPVRFARVTNGTVEYVGTFHGNAQGFQSSKDFTVKKPAGIRHRDIVLGDCFSSGSFVETNWPTRVEASCPDRELLNFSIDGVGLANWWSILARYIEPNHYEFDSVIFAAIANDLNRPFVVADWRRDTSVMIGYAVWSRDSFALDSKRAFHLLNYLTMLKVTPDDFDASIKEGRLHRQRTVSQAAVCEGTASVHAGMSRSRSARLQRQRVLQRRSDVGHPGYPRSTGQAAHAGHGHLHRGSRRNPRASRRIGPGSKVRGPARRPISRRLGGVSRAEREGNPRVLFTVRRTLEPGGFGPLRQLRREQSERSGSIRIAARVGRRSLQRQSPESTNPAQYLGRSFLDAGVSSSPVSRPRGGLASLSIQIWASRRA